MLGTTSKPLLSADYQQVTVDLSESAMHLFDVGDATQLDVFWLYSYIKVGLLSADAILQVNCHPATTLSLFVKELLTFCSKSIKFWLNSSAWIAQMSTLFWSCRSLQTLALLLLDKDNKKFTVKDRHTQLAVSKL